MTGSVSSPIETGLDGQKTGCYRQKPADKKAATASKDAKKKPPLNDVKVEEKDTKADSGPPQNASLLIKQTADEKRRAAKEKERAKQAAQVKGKKESKEIAC